MPISPFLYIFFLHIGLPHSPRCPFPDLNSNSTYFPHPKKCELFYECSNGVEVQFECPAGLHFNPTINVCDYPWRAGCVI